MCVCVCESKPASYYASGVSLQLIGLQSFDQKTSLWQVYLQESFLPPDHGEAHNLWWKRLPLKLDNARSPQRHQHDITKTSSWCLCGRWRENWKRFADCCSLISHFFVCSSFTKYFSVVVLKCVHVLTVAYVKCKKKKKGFRKKEKKKDKFYHVFQ